MNNWPNAYDWDTDEEHRDAGERLKRHLGDAERIKGDPTLQGREDQEIIAKEITDLKRQLEVWAASRKRRADFQRRRLLPPD